MPRSADELVSEFCRLWATPDPKQLAGYFTEDAVYHNIPMQPVRGRDAIEQFIVVMNERTDVMRRKDGVEIPLPVMGVFEIENDHIKAWRDYFDMATVTRAFG